MALVKRQNFVFSANFHGDAQVVCYPWDNGVPSGTNSAFPDDRWYVQLATLYAAKNPDMGAGIISVPIVNGNKWYTIYGGRRDWMYFYGGGRENTIELWDVKNPPDSVLSERWLNNKESFLTFMEQVFHGVRGKVIDAVNGQPLVARIDVESFSGVPVYSDPDLGDFY